MRGAGGRQCYLGNNVRNVFQCVLTCSIFVQNYIKFELIITELCSVMYSLNILTQLVTSQLIYILYIFVNNFATKRDSITVNGQSAYFFHDLLHETIKNFFANAFKFS